MATAPVSDADLRSIQQARTLAARARAAQKVLAGFSQEQVDAIVDAMAAAARQDAERLARLAHEETGFGNVKDKTKKNLFSAVVVGRSAAQLVETMAGAGFEQEPLVVLEMNQ